MWKWLEWLLYGSDEGKTTSVSKPVEEKESKGNVKGFVDPETGKVYKTAGSLKAAQTRRRNKGKKKTKKSKK